MPSPIAHLSLILIVRAIAARKAALRRAVRGQPLFFYIAALATLSAPDIDFLIGAVFDQPHLGHGGATHSLAMGLLFGLSFAAVCRMKYGALFPVTLGCGLGTACAWAHAVMDMATWGRGVMLLWPVSLERYVTITLFFGAHRSQPTAWRLHLITLVTELLFVLPLWWAMRRFWRDEDPREATPPPVRAVSSASGVAGPSL